MKEKIVSLGYILENYKKYDVILEHRQKKYMFGAKNYGEIIGLKNFADGDRWDIFIPGYDFKLEIGKEIKIFKIIGFLYLTNGNHKIAVRINTEGFNQQACDLEISNYTRTYISKNKKTGMFIYL
tara:strand:- start:2526 stop:2900 length:375 start_codon:yes stop_codon:yes gene_type:complete